MDHRRGAGRPDRGVDDELGPQHLVAVADHVGRELRPVAEGELRCVAPAVDLGTRPSDQHPRRCGRWAVRRASRGAVVRGSRVDCALLGFGRGPRSRTPLPRRRGAAGHRCAAGEGAHRRRVVSDDPQRAADGLQPELEPLAGGGLRRSHRHRCPRSAEVNRPGPDGLRQPRVAHREVPPGARRAPGPRRRGAGRDHRAAPPRALHPGRAPHAHRAPAPLRREGGRGGGPGPPPGPARGPGGGAAPPGRPARQPLDPPARPGRRVGPAGRAGPAVAGPGRSLGVTEALLADGPVARDARVVAAYDTVARAYADAPARRARRQAARPLAARAAGRARPAAARWPTPGAGRARWRSTSPPPGPR